MVAVDTTCSGSGMVVGGSVVSVAMVGSSVSSVAARVGASVGAAVPEGVLKHRAITAVSATSSRTIRAIRTPTMAEPLFLRLEWEKDMEVVLLMRLPQKKQWLVRFRLAPRQEPGPPGPSGGRRQ